MEPTNNIKVNDRVAWFSHTHDGDINIAGFGTVLEVNQSNDPDSTSIVILCDNGMIEDFCLSDVILYEEWDE